MSISKTKPAFPRWLATALMALAIGPWCTRATAQTAVAGPLPALVQSAYVPFSEFAPGTSIRSQYQWLGLLFSTGTIRPHGSGRWLSIDASSLTVSLRDTNGAAPLAVQAFSFDIDSAAGGGRFQVDAYDRGGAPVLSTLAVGGTRVQLHGNEISTVRLTPLDGIRQWGVSGLRSGADAVPQAIGHSVQVCSTYSGGYPNTSMTLYVVAPPMGPVSTLADNTGCAALLAAPVPATLAIYAYYVPPVHTCLSYNGQPIADQYVPGFYIPFLYLAPPSGTLSAGAASDFSISATTDSTGCLDLTMGNPTVGYLSFQGAQVDLGRL